MKKNARQKHVKNNTAHNSYSLVYFDCVQLMSSVFSNMKNWKSNSNEHRVLNGDMLFYNIAGLDAFYSVPVIVPPMALFKYRLLENNVIFFSLN